MRSPLIAALGAFIALVACARAQQNDPPHPRGVIKLDDGTRVQVEEFPGPSKWNFLPHMFTAATVSVQCPSHADFAVYSGHHMEDVRAAYGRGDRAWCGWDRLLGRNKHTCVVPISPFGTTFVAVAKPKGWFSSGDNAASAACIMRKEIEFSTSRFLTAVVGAFLFSAAPQLAVSTPFRLAGGTAGFTLLSTLIVLILLYRSVPHKKSFVAASLAFGSSVLAAARLAFGVWLPSIAQLTRNPLVLGYIATSALMGLAVTYYYDNVADQKINTMLRVALQATGLGMVAGAASSREGGTAAVVALLAAKLAPAVRRERALMPALRHAGGQVAHDIATSVPHRGLLGGGGEAFEEGVADVARRTRRVTAALANRVTAQPIATEPGTPPGPSIGGTAAGGAGVEAAGAFPSTEEKEEDYEEREARVSPLVQRGLILNEETGKIIHIGKSTYNKLVVAGYEVNKKEGVITPPGKAGFGSAGKLKGAGRRRSR